MGSRSLFQGTHGATEFLEAKGPATAATAALLGTARGCQGSYDAPWASNHGWSCWFVPVIGIYKGDFYQL